MTRATLPNASENVLDSGGRFNTSWRRFMESLFRRTGATYDLDIVPTSDTTVDIRLRGSDGVLRVNTLTLAEPPP